MKKNKQKKTWLFIGLCFSCVPLSQLGGAAAPQDWQGSFNCTYNYGGPGFTNTSVFKTR